MYEQTRNEKSELNMTESEEFEFVNSVAKRFIGRGVEKEELFQLGYIGLIKAKKNYKKERNEATFKTYAYYYVEGEIRSFFRQNRCIRFPRKYLSSIRGKRQAIGSSDLVEEKNECKNASNKQYGLNSERAMPWLNDYSELFNSIFKRIIINNAIFDNDPIDELITKMDIESAMTKLTSIERTVIELKYFNNESQKQIGNALGLSQSQISRYEKKALAKLRQ